MPQKRTSGLSEAAARESAIVRSIERAARRRAPDLALAKRHGTAFGQAGEPDLYGCFRGRHFEIEVKRPGEKPTRLQEMRLSRWAAAGAITGVAHSVDEFFQVLGDGNS